MHGWTFIAPLLQTLFLLIGLSGCYGNTSATDPEAAAASLIELLQDEDPRMRRTAAQALGKIAAPDSAGALLRSLGDADPSVRVMSAWALGRLGEDVLDSAGLDLAKRLDDRSPAVKLAAAEALGEIGGSQTIVDLLTERLSHPNVDTRRAVVQALTALEAGSAHHALIAALADSDAQVRQGAVAALGEMVEARSLPPIRDRLLKDQDPGVRGEAAFRLGKFGDLTVVPALRSASARDPDATVRRWAAWALRQIEQG